MKILVCGDVCKDVYVYGAVGKLCQEAPVAVFNPVTVVSNEGMAGNVAANLRSLGATVDLVCNSETIIKKRIVDQKSNQMIVRIDENDIVSTPINIDKINFNLYDAVIVSDYDKGFISLQDLKYISNCHKLTFLDTKKPLDKKHMGGFTFIKINEGEWQRSIEAGNDYHDWKEKLIVTLSERGCMYQGMNYEPDAKVEVRDVSGAGDTFLAALSYKYVETKDISASLRFANVCAGVVVTKKGVSVI
ncbi:MAG TPA: PfkB family carbohydrate kinase [Agriterribacter sp.]|nr:PfkB family carbohydrate kinase [Agriterribacter sp.]